MWTFWLAGRILPPSWRFAARSPPTTAGRIRAVDGWGDGTRRGMYQQSFHRIDSERIVNVAFDLICSDGISAGVVSAYSPSLLRAGTESVEGVPMCAVAAYMKSGFVKALAGVEAGFNRVEESAISPDARRHIIRLCGERFLTAYEGCIRRGAIRSEWRRVRTHAQVAFTLRHPLTAFRNGMLSLVRRSVGSRVAHVRSVGIVGPDGVGKSAAVAYACRTLASAFVDVRCRHWRPGVLPSLSRLLGTTDPAVDVSAPDPTTAARWSLGNSSVAVPTGWITRPDIGSATGDRPVPRFPSIYTIGVRST